MARIPDDVLAEALRHVYGAPCDRPGCVFCQEWPAVKAMIDREDAVDITDLRQCDPSVRRFWGMS